MSKYNLKFAVVSVGLALCLSGCMGFQTQKMQAENLVPDQFDIEKKTHKLVLVKVNSEANSSMLMRLPGVPVDGMRSALKESIEASGLFRKTEYWSEADYTLEVTVLPSKTMKKGSEEYFWSPARWELKDSKTGEVVFNERIVKWHDVNVNEVPNQEERNTLLVEGAVKNNIREAIEQMADLDF